MLLAALWFGCTAPALADPPIFGPVGLSISAVSTADSGSTLVVILSASDPTPTSMVLDSLALRLPPGLAYQAGSSTAGPPVTTTEPDGSQEISWGPLAVGAGRTLKIRVALAVSATPGVAELLATAQGAGASEPLTPAVASVRIRPSVNVTLAQEASHARGNQPEGYTLTVTNESSGDASISAVSLAVPTGFEDVPGTTRGMVNTDPKVDAASSTMTWMIPTLVLPAQQSAMLHVELVGPSGRYVLDPTVTTQAAGDIPDATGGEPVTVQLASSASNASCSSTLHVGTLLASGCWQLSGKQQYTSTGPVDAGGLLLQPQQGARIVLDTSANQLSASGTVAVGVGSVSLGTLHGSWDLTQPISIADPTADLAGFHITTAVVSFSDDGGFNAAVTADIPGLGVSGQATLRGSIGVGLETPEIDLNADTAALGRVAFSSIDVRYAGRGHDGDAWNGTATAEIPGTGGAVASEAASLQFLGGQLTGIDLGGPAPAGNTSSPSFGRGLTLVRPQLTVGARIPKNASLPPAVTGAAEVSVGGPVPGSPMLDAVGNLSYLDGAQCAGAIGTRWRLSGALTAIGIAGIDGWLCFLTSGEAHVDGFLVATHDGVAVEGRVSGAVAPGGGMLLTGRRAILVLPGFPDPVPGEVKVTEGGVQACAWVNGFPHRIGFLLSASGEVQFGCRVARAQTFTRAPGAALPSTRHGRSLGVRSAQSEWHKRFTGSSAPLVITVDGHGGLPTFTLRGPADLTVDVADATTSVGTDGAQLVDSATQTVVLELPTTLGGVYVVEPDPESPPITVTYAQGLTRVRLDVQVMGSGYKRLLIWRQGAGASPPRILPSISSRPWGKWPRARLELVSRHAASCSSGRRRSL